MMRERQRETIQLFFGSLATLFFVAFMGSAQAATHKVNSIECKTNFGEKSFTIEEESVAFHQVQEKVGRSVSSVYEARTQKTHKGIRKSLYLNGNKHLIHIENFKDFDASKDYLAVTSPKGHKMTYPLNCGFMK
ncbi:MAG: hypothetical protein KC478_06740 [Bacteriovoracaceae bacterium]|nr:hypothetical protein [Bacteriovoracaceae bacterium]